MHVRILKQMAGVLDGVSLGHLQPGLIYEVEESLGAYLLTTESAEEVSLSESSTTESNGDLIEHVARGGVTVTHRSQPLEKVVSHDQPRKPRRKRR